MSNTSELQDMDSKVKEIILINEDLTDIPQDILNEKSVDVRLLNLSHNNLQKLYGLEWFSKLEELVLDNNDIDDSSCFPRIPTLKSLTLNNNKLVDLKSLMNKVSKSYPSLEYLSLLGNKICPMNFSSPNYKASDYHQYRCLVACLLPKLIFLDWKAITLAERYGSLPNINKPVSSLGNLPSNTYTPLPKTDDSMMEEGNVVAGTLKHKYVGKRSEGNRFIRNTDL